MPWKSEAERRWGNSPSGVAAMGQAKVNEFNRATKGKDLPERVGPRMRAGVKKLAAAKRKSRRVHAPVHTRTVNAMKSAGGM